MLDLDYFKAKAEAVGAEVHRAADLPGAVAVVAGVLEREGVADAAGARAAWCEGPLLGGKLDRPALQRRFPGLSFAVTRAVAEQCRVGVSEMDWALAATGSVAQDASDPRLRLVSMLPEVHVALVRADALLPDIGALLARIDPRRIRYLTCITGPSRTADIERVLTIGVHGPKKLVLVVVDAPAEARAERSGAEAPCPAAS